ncbi:DUF4236 domain-containing protein [Arthrobacter sp. ISL-85]|uniref:DUF4236 domain-containing protein n=1 Tax=Arthrobacter sp. ISL-85 TaxID=2819115 RepID=UPI001BE7B787|nr:DUF4236 domain-containing protein [Arthrobacter sp. ISL-85]
MSFRVAPGVRVSASSRGIRTSIGNSRARVSFGAGGTYTSAKMGGVRIQNWSGAGGLQPSLAGLSRADKDAAVRELARLERALVTLHHEPVPAAAPYHVPLPAPADREKIRLNREKELLANINFFKFTQRKAAKDLARRYATAEAARMDASQPNNTMLSPGKRRRSGGC